MTPDTPALFFWTASLAALARLLATGRGVWWLAAGVAIGLGLDSKYTLFLLGPAILAWLALTPRLRPWFLRWQPYAGAAIAALAFSPVVAWNAAHDWASFAKQGGRVGDWQPARAAQFLGELVGSQFGLATPLIAILCAAGLAHAWRLARRGDPAASLLAALTVVPILVFVQHALGDRVQANWPAILYPAAAVAACGLGGGWLRWRTPAIVLGFALTAIVYLQAALAPLPLPVRLDPTARLRFWPDLAASVAEAAHAQGATFVAADNYGVAAELARLLPPDLVALGDEPRWADFSLPDASAAMVGRPGLLVRSARRDDNPDFTPWATLSRLGEVARGAHGVVAESYRLYRVTGGGGGTLVQLPRPR